MKFIHNQLGQDLIEYMLLTAFIAITGYTGIQILSNAMGNNYNKWNSATQEIWETPPPCKTTGKC